MVKTVGTLRGMLIVETNDAISPFRRERWPLRTSAVSGRWSTELGAHQLQSCFNNCHPIAKPIGTADLRRYEPNHHTVAPELPIVGKLT